MFSIRIRSAFLLGASLAACNPAAPEASPRIRVANDGGHDLQAVVINFSMNRVEYGDLPAGSASEYREIDQAYRYAYIEAWVGGEKLVLQPIDYVGEPLLEPGAYTYSLRALPWGDRFVLGFELRRDGR